MLIGKWKWWGSSVNNTDNGAKDYDIEWTERSVIKGFEDGSFRLDDENDEVMCLSILCIKHTDTMSQVWFSHSVNKQI